MPAREKRLKAVEMCTFWHKSWLDLKVIFTNASPAEK
jgi:hypothetical protein